MVARTHLLTAALSAAALMFAATPAMPQSPVALEKAVVKEMNQARVSHNRAPLRGFAKLTRAARGHSGWMASSGTFQHESANGQPFWTRIVRQGYPGNRRMSENIAMLPSCDADAAAWVVRLWMDSPGHRKNLLDPKVKYTGVGISVVGDCDQVFITADYAG